MQRSIWVFAFFSMLAACGWAQNIIPAPAIQLGGQGPAPSTPQPSVPPEQLCVVAGRLTNALTGEPVKKATVRLTANRAGANGTALMATAAGTFSARRPGIFDYYGQRGLVPD